MSTCPNKDLYSAYADGEILSPWKEKLEAHLSNCASCKKVLDTYINLKNSLSDKTIPEINLEESFCKLCVKKQRAALRVEISNNKVNKWFSKSVNIPLPAFVAAALFLFVFTPVLMIYSVKDSAKPQIVSDFKPIVPVTEIKQKAKQFNFKVPPMLTISNLNGKKNLQKRIINFNQFAGLYLPSEVMKEASLLQSNDFSEFDVEQPEFKLSSVKNGQ